MMEIKVKGNNERVGLAALVNALYEGYKLPPAVFASAVTQVEEALKQPESNLEADLLYKAKMGLREYKCRNKAVIMKTVEELEKLVEVYETYGMDAQLQAAKTKLKMQKQRALHFDMMARF